MPYRYKGFGDTRNPGVSVSAPATVAGCPSGQLLRPSPGGGPGQCYTPTCAPGYQWNGDPLGTCVAVGDPGPNIPGVMNLGGGNGRLISSQPSMAAGANSGQGLTDTRGLVLLPLAVSSTPAAVAAVTNVTTPVASAPAATTTAPFSDPWFLGYVGVAALAAFGLKGRGKFLAAIPLLMAYNQYGVDTTGTSPFYVSL